MTRPTSPEQLFRHGLRLLLDKDTDGWVGLCADSCVFEFPYAPEGFPRRLEGRAAVADYMRGYTDHIDLREIPETTVHRTEDPRTIVAEFRATGRLVATDEPYAMSYVMVLTVEQGSIVHCRDYWNPLGLPGSAHGGLSPFASATGTSAGTSA
ncbi:nuclear transport factor 2 family protein [Streptomyces lycii]|uniref:Nuclear transport factor 2 family protein n=1 Tax=Streptomyces lycii TaxID=2654337 RepID=A0ABQ7FIJ9_9ACTN|nr:nuclear transport factor 2 family protein [Streptomyces lycii]KAF4408804.1 nuclear transport factor 2 family protein [Streptomyces lycii]